MGRSYDEEDVEFADAALPRLTRTAYLVCADPHRAADVAQQALIKLYLAWPKVSRRGSLLPYARRAALRLLIDESRRPWRREVSHADLSRTETLLPPDPFRRVGRGDRHTARTRPPAGRWRPIGTESVCGTEPLRGAEPQGNRPGERLQSCGRPERCVRRHRSDCQLEGSGCCVQQRKPRRRCDVTERNDVGQLRRPPRLGHGRDSASPERRG